MKISCESSKETPKKYYELETNCAYWTDSVGLFIFLTDGIGEFLFVVNKSSMSSFEYNLIPLQDVAYQETQFYPWYGEITINV